VLYFNKSNKNNSTLKGDTNMRILIADDESEIRKILRLLLENKGHDII